MVATWDAEPGDAAENSVRCLQRSHAGAQEEMQALLQKEHCQSLTAIRLRCYHILSPLQVAFGHVRAFPSIFMVCCAISVEFVCKRVFTDATPIVKRVAQYISRSIQLLLASFWPHVFAQICNSHPFLCKLHAAPAVTDVVI